MKKLLIVLLLSFWIEGNANPKNNENPRDTISIKGLMLLSKNSKDLSPNFKKFVWDNISFEVKALCLCYTGKREYRKLLNFVLPKNMTGQDMLEIYRPKVFDLDHLYLLSGKYLESTLVYKNTINIFFVRKRDIVYLVAISFKGGKWHADAFNIDEPFQWLSGARMNI